MAGAPGGIQTPDPRFRRPMLYSLSYGRVVERSARPADHWPFREILSRRLALARGPLQAVAPHQRPARKGCEARTEPLRKPVRMRPGPTSWVQKALEPAGRALRVGSWSPVMRDRTANQNQGHRGRNHTESSGLPGGPIGRAPSVVKQGARPDLPHGKDSLPEIINLTQPAHLQPKPAPP